jgi:tRNA-specific 2-thiouridylase
MGNGQMKAIALFSGGLDSMLAIKVLQEQGIEVIAVNFNIGFGSTEDRREHMQKVAKEVGVELVIADVRERYVSEVLFSPKYGYGSAFNPCIDCHGNMFKWAKEYMDKYGASFVISGEVLNERPMSQRKEAMNQVEKISGLTGLVLRPLSAKFMAPTTPELEGWVDREQLLDLEGRSRKRQYELVEKYGIDYFESPGGGCLLTDKFVAIKIRDFIRYDNFTKADIDVIKFGRHFRVGPTAKLVVGRHQEDNEKIRGIVNEKFDTVHMPEGIIGPVSLLAKSATPSEREAAAKIILTYGRTEAGKNYTLRIGTHEITATPFPSKNDVREMLLQ